MTSLGHILYIASHTELYNDFLCSLPSYRLCSSALLGKNIDLWCGWNFQKDDDNVSMMWARACSEHVQPWIQSHIHGTCLSFFSTAAWPALSFLCPGTISEQQLNVMNPISTSTRAPSLLKQLQSKNTECIDQQPFFFRISDKKPEREGRLLEGFEWWSTKWSISVVYIWKVPAQSVGAFTWIVLYAV